MADRSRAASNGRGEVELLHHPILYSQMEHASGPEERRKSFASMSLPEASSSAVIGLLDFLNARGGREDVLQIASDTGCAVETVVAAVKAAELLGFVCTPGRLVALESEGRRFLQASPQERPALWRKRLLRLRCFREVHDVLRMRPSRRIDRGGVLEMLRRYASPSDSAKVFQAFVDWGRRGELFAYEDSTRLFSV